MPSTSEASAGCEECRSLGTHRFRTADDLLHAFQTAAAEVDRGVLRRIDARTLEPAEQAAMDSVLEAGALPGALRYRFECALCGDRFELEGDPATGAGGWTRVAPGA